ncbi:MAG: glycosyltransferase [Lachnospiraceae bacterium]|nr:glycosyltransferase [Lachnospiraceae bacterium]
MKLLTIAIPCFNSENYMRRCVDSLLPGGNDLEILIVDDGSYKDHTWDIAREYEKNYPGMVRAIHQENKGHGGAVNTGLQNAQGLYFKVVDSDDWLKTEDLITVMDMLRSVVGGNRILDALICNYVYEKQGEKKKKVIQYRRMFPVGEIFEWSEIRQLPQGHYMLMHSLIYRTQLLRECGLRLPEHTFYVDNLFAFEPLPHVRTLMYLDLNLYRYFIGREDQSVNEGFMCKHMDQQLRVNRRMIDYMVENRGKIVQNRKLRRYMINYLEIVTAVSSILLILTDTSESLQEKTDLWHYIKKKDLRLYLIMRNSLLGNGTNLPGRGGRKLSAEAYKLAQKYYGFN